jgi:N-acetylglutamate synthase-like GNAT family acetyltransferase
VLYGCFQDGQLCGVAELHPAAPGEPAEAAFVVSPDAQHHGIGTALLDVIVLAARNRNNSVIPSLVEPDSRWVAVRKGV